MTDKIIQISAVWKNRPDREDCDLFVYGLSSSGILYRRDEGGSWIKLEESPEITFGNEQINTGYPDGKEES